MTATVLTRSSAQAPANTSSLTVVDQRTGKQYEIPITDGTIRASDLRQIKDGAVMISG